jgi:hypothetical protein
MPAPHPKRDLVCAAFDLFDDLPDHGRRCMSALFHPNVAPLLCHFRRDRVPADDAAETGIELWVAFARDSAREQTIWSSATLRTTMYYRNSLAEFIAECTLDGVSCPVLVVPARRPGFVSVKFAKLDHSEDAEEDEPFGPMAGILGADY